MRLRDRHFRLLLDALGQLYSDVSPESLAERALGAVGGMVCGEIVAFDSFTDDGVHTGEKWHDPPGTISSELYEVFGELAPEHPFSPYVFSRAHRKAMMISDYISAQNFEKTAIYNEFYRHFPVQSQLLVPITTTPGSLVTCAINRRGRGFTEEERLMLNLFAPHIGNAIKNSPHCQDSCRF